MTGRKDKRIKLVVFAEHTLGYIQPQLPKYVAILHASTLKRAVKFDGSLMHNENYRLATPADFDEFRVCFKGFDNKEEYIYSDNKKNI